MYILTNGKDYVMKNPVENAKKEYISTTNPNLATKFDYRTARNLMQSNRKAVSFIKEKCMNMIDYDSGEVEKEAKTYRGNGGIYLGKNEIDFDDTMLDLIYSETKSILHLNGWSLNQLKTYKQALSTGLSICDSRESDITHALQKYKEDNDGKKPQAHKMAKVGYILDEVRDKRKHIKQCMNYINVMENAIANGYSLEKMKLELTKAKHVDYKGRTEYYQMVLDILG